MALYSWLTNSGVTDYALSTCTVLALGLLGGLYAFQTRLLYLPDFPPDSRKTIWRPSKFGLAKYEEVSLTSSDGVRLKAFWIPVQEGDPKGVPTILFFQANAGNMGHRLPIIKRLSQVAPANFLLLSYRGYGESEGVPEEQGIRRDAQAALDYLLEERSQELDLHRIIVYGQSIGGAVAIDLASRNQSKIAAVIVENTFLSIPQIIPHVMPWLRWFTGLCHQRWDSERCIRGMIEVAEQGDPVFPHTLLLIGSRDELVPSSHGQRLYALITSCSACRDRVQLRVFEQGTHNDTCLQPGYFEAIANFLIAFSK